MSLVTFLVSGYERNVGSALLWPAGASNNDASRYVVVPTLLLSSALFVALDGRARSVAHPDWPRLRAGLGMLVLVAALFSFDVSDKTNRGSPTWSTALHVARLTCARTHTATIPVPVAGPPYFGFAFDLPCSKLK
jgi:hypothetical protein